MTELSFMGICDVEPFRARVYGLAEQDRERLSFLRQLGTTGVLDCPAYDRWIQALQKRGWVPSEPDLEPVPGGGRGNHARWRLTPAGMLALARLEKGA